MEARSVPAEGDQDDRLLGRLSEARQTLETEIG